MYAAGANANSHNLCLWVCACVCARYTRAPVDKCMCVLMSVEASGVQMSPSPAPHFTKAIFDSIFLAFNYVLVSVYV